MISPLKNGRIDKNTLFNLIEWQISKGIKAILICGSTGEFSLLTKEEREAIIYNSIIASNGRVPIIVGCNFINPKDIISFSIRSKELGASSMLISAPCYIKPSSDGIFKYFKKIHDHIQFPIIIYNNPARSLVDISIETIIKLSKLPFIIGLKDSTNDIYRITLLRKAIGKDFLYFCGDDINFIPYLANGGDGIISVAANIIPDIFCRILNYWKEGNLKLLAETRDLIYPLLISLNSEVNPIPIKFAMSYLKLCKNELKIPLLPASIKTRKYIIKAIKEINL